MANCRDCGNRMYNDICSWCHEQTYIEREFAEELGEFRAETGTRMSSDWKKALEDQAEAIKENKEARPMTNNLSDKEK